MYGDGRVFQRGPFWWIAYSHLGIEHRESSRSTKRSVAQKLLRERLAQLDQGLGLLARAQKTRMSTLLTALVTDMELRNVSSVAGIRSHLKPLEQFFGGLSVAQVTERTIDQFITDRSSKGFAPATINRQTALLGQALKLGYRRQQVVRVPHIRRLPAHNARQGFFERHELEAVIAHLPAYLQDLTWFAYYTGWRQGEILSLEWRDVDRQSQVIRLRAERTKSRKPRIIVLHRPLQSLMERRWQERIVGERIVAYVFHRNGYPIRDFQTAWENARRRAGCTHRLFHDLRRTAVRNMIRAGVPERVAMEIVGHKTRVMLDRYHIVNDQDIREAMAKLEGAEHGKVVRLHQEG